MTSRKLNLAGWLSIANAVLLPVSLSMTVLTLFARGDNQLIFLIIALIITFIRHGFYLYTFSCFKKLLNSRFQFRDADKFISQILRLNRLPFVLVALNITLFLTLGLIERITGVRTLELEGLGWILGGSLVLYWLAMILTGIFYMLTGVEISRLCRNRRKEVLGAFSQSLTITGWLLASLFLAPLGFLLAIQADVFLGSIFFNIARES
jgi:hypothetical protein